MRAVTDAQPPGPIAIDGPAASGKSSVGQALAELLGFGFLDTGLMYRAFTLEAIRQDVSPEDAAACGELAATLPMRFEPGGAGRIFLGEEDVTGLLRGDDVEANVSAYSAIPAVREAMVARQRQLAAGGRVVLAGRDIGTVVLADAPLKLFLTASEEARARRRSAQSSEWGAAATEDASREFIKGRDRVDSSRSASPLTPAPDAIVIDTSEMTLDEVIAKAASLAQSKAQRVPRQSRYKTETRTFRYGRFTPAFYAFGHYMVRVLLFLLTRYRVYGRENVPPRGVALIIASNHLNNMDPPVIAAAIPRRQRIRWMGKIELFRGPLFYVANLWGAFPLRRFEADLGAMLNAERILRAGGCVGMFPEGTRSRTWRMARLQTGTATIALHTGTTLLPVGISGTEHVSNPRVLILKRPRIRVRIGEPIPVERVRKPTPEQVSELTALLDSSIRALLPADYGGTYTG
jgi:cytidylate kinase